MDINNRLLKVQARLDTILYRDNGIKPNLEDYNLYSKERPIGRDLYKKAFNRASLANECLVLFFVIADSDFQEHILTYVDQLTVTTYTGDFYYKIFNENPWSTEEEWKAMQLRIAKRFHGAVDGIRETHLVDSTTFKEVLELLATSTNNGVCNDAKERLEKDFSDT